ncbi:hypothetical protein HYH03_010289 [Edaphochlamys debaryana]|uniref:Uncharacterized protein n=1 Tax=Edaphochlamys debaryana TaxID=47281 RepID=A0A835XW31_9CHLO|nr:hypothetical protein HYH03_010289 [Edaphochlamys debaryana]|eukprot:KAG2491283.1 hypothetical protein HYH03_010289 [Edaphochlamys debaryana]
MGPGRRWGREERLDLGVQASILLLSALSAMTLTREMCSGKDPEGRVVPFGTVLRAFPCAAGLGSQLRFLLVNAITIVREMLTVKREGSDAAFFWCNLLWLSRVVSLFLLPRWVYVKIAAPILTYGVRAAPLLLWIAAGTGEGALSKSSATMLFKINPIGDAFTALTQPEIIPVAEATFNALALAAVALLTARHGALFRDLGASLRPQLLLRLAAIAVVHVVASYRRGRASPTGRPPRGGGAPPAAPLKGAAAAGGAAGPWTSRFECHEDAQDCAATEAAGAKGAEAGAGTGTGASELPAETVLALAAAQAAKVAPAAEEAGADGALVQAGGALRLSGFLAPRSTPYRSLARRRTTRIKIPWAEPHQLHPDFAERLSSLAQSRGLILSNVYVRAGCIELLLDEEAWSVALLRAEAHAHNCTRSPGFNADDDEGGADLALERLLAAMVAQGNVPGSSNSTGARNDDGDEDDDKEKADADADANISKVDTHARVDLSTDAWDLGAVIRALCLDMPSTMASGRASSTQETDDAKAGAGDTAEGSSPLWRIAQDAVLGPGFSCDAPRVLRMQPRIICRPRAGPPRTPSRATGSTAFARFTVEVSRPSCDDWAEPEVLARGQGAYYPARATYRPCADGATADVYGADVDGLALYDIELLQLPVQPGAIVLELRWGNRLSRAAPVVVLEDPAMAAELQQVVRALYDRPDQLDDLLLDLGTWLHHAAAARTAAANGPAGAAESPAPTAAGPNGPDRPEPQPLAGAPLMPGRVRLLAGHLLSYANACGWSATAAAIRADLEAAPGAGTGPDATDLGVSLGAAGARAAVSGASTGATLAAGEVQGSTADQPVAEIEAEATAGTSGAVSRGRAGAAGRPVAGEGWAALALAGGWACAPPEEEAAFQAYAEPLIFMQGMVMQAMEVLSLLALLFRARHDLLSPGNLTTLSGCAMGTLTTAAWPFLSRRSWVALVNAAKVPRYLFHMAAKLMIGWLGFPAPPGIVPYQMGLAMLVMEGLLLPGSCLLPFRTALVLTLLKWPLGIGMMLESGATDDVALATMLTARVVVVAMATTLACHAYLRLCFRRRSAAMALRAPGGAVPKLKIS